MVYYEKNCKTCTLNTTNDTIETCKRMCYLRYSKQRNKRICDLEQKIQNLKQTLAEIKEIAEKTKKDICNNCGWKNADSCDPENYTCGELIKILQKISECEAENERKENCN